MPVKRITAAPKVVETPLGKLQREGAEMRARDARMRAALAKPQTAGAHDKEKATT